jgi:drug/metabolite transporter (DMT)-like permease
MTENNKNYLYFGLVSSMLMWGLGWPSTKILTEYATPIHLAVIRFLLTYCTLFLILIFLKQKLGISKKGIYKLILGSILMSAYTMMFLYGIQYGSPGAGGVLVTTITPIATYVLTILLAKRKPTTYETIGLLLGLVAACFLMHVWYGFHKILQSGNIYFFISCFLWAILSRITAKANQYGSPLTFSFWMYGCCFVILLPFAKFDLLFHLIQQKEIRFWLNLFYNASINTGIATTLFFYATSKLGAAKSSSFLYIVPFAAAFFSWIILGEIIHWYTIVGGSIGIIAVFVLNRKKDDLRIKT